MDESTESAIAAMRGTGLHRCTACRQGRCETPSACALPEPESESARGRIVYALTIAVAVIGVAAALFS